MPDTPVYIDDETWPRTTDCVPGYGGCEYGPGHGCATTTRYPERFTGRDHVRHTVPPSERS